MFVGERMSHPVFALGPDVPITEALDLMRREHIRRAPVIKDGKLLGIVSEKDLLHASPSPATSLSIWELNYLLTKVTVKEVMTKEVFTVSEDTPIEVAARIMVDNKIGGLPVVRGNEVVGMITETDLFRLFLELLGAREVGVRVTALVPDKPGQFARIGKVFADSNANIISLGAFAGKSASNRMITFKVVGLDIQKVKELVSPVVEAVLDIREC